MLNHALKYRSQGLSVIPLRPCGKEPIIFWTEFQSRLATETEIKEWWTKWPDANIGIVTGAISGLAIIDLDGPEGLQSAQKLNLTSGLISITGNGKHLWLKHPGSLVQNAVRLYPGLDIRGDAGYVVAPPSVHESGVRYRWLNVFNAEKLQDFPAELFVTSVGKKDSEDGNKEGWIADALQEMKHGNIDDTIFRIASRLRGDGYSAADCKMLLQPHAERVGATPGHLEDKIENVWARYTPNERSDNRPNVVRRTEGLVIHSPTNRDSWDNYRKTILRGESDAENTSLKTGYQKLDEMLKGGLKSSRLFTVAARTGVGKTNWLLGAVRALCESGRTVLLFSTEMPYTQIWERYIQTLTKPEVFTGHKFNVYDSFAPNLERVEEVINEIKPDVFMFDHINHVSEDQKELGAFMQGLNYIRRKYECAGIVTAQLNRQADWVDIKTGEKVTPRMSMIKGSGTIEQASSRVLLLSETRVTNEMSEIVGNLDKNDNGLKGLVHFGLMTKPYKMVEL